MLVLPAGVGSAMARYNTAPRGLAQAPLRVRRDPQYLQTYYRAVMAPVCAVVMDAPCVSGTTTATRRTRTGRQYNLTRDSECSIHVQQT